MPEVNEQFDHCVIVHNPASTRAASAEWRIPELKKLFLAKNVTVLRTSAKGKQANRDLLLKHAAKLGERTLLAIIAGDGTINLILDVLLHDPRLQAVMRRTTILPVWGGNANDLAVMLNGPRRRVSTRRLLEEGRAVAIHPLRCDITDTNGHSESYVAACYASFGASAFTARWLDTTGRQKLSARRMPGMRFARELIMVFHAMTKAPRFTVTNNGTTKPIYEQIFINGSRFAKVKGPSHNLTDKTFFWATVERKRVSSVAYHIIQLIRHPSTREVGSHETVSFTVHEAVWAQFDGEAMQLPANTTVHLYLSPQPFYALSTLLQPPENSQR